MPKPPSTDAVPAIPDVLLVVGEPRTSEPLSALLELAGYRTVVVDRATHAGPLLTERQFDLVILDVTLPDTAALRHSHRLLAPDRPAVLLLTGTGEFLGSLPGGGTGRSRGSAPGPGTGVRPTTSGRVAEVLARARQLVGRQEPAGWDGALRYGDLVLDDATRRARRGERTIELTPAEYRLLRCPTRLRLLARRDRAAVEPPALRTTIGSVCRSSHRPGVRDMSGSCQPDSLH